MEAAARSCGGEVFATGSGDLVLVGGVQDRPAEMEGLAGVFARLLRLDASDPTRLTTRWDLPREAPGLLAYAQAAADVDARAPTIAPALAEPPRPGVRSQAIVAVTRDGTTLLHRRISAAPAPIRTEDGWQARHERRARDPALIAHLAEAAGKGGPLDPLGTVPALVALGLPALESDAFAALAARAAGRLAVEVALPELAAEPRRFAAARSQLAAAGVQVALGEVPLLALPAVRLDTWTLSFVVLGWLDHPAEPSSAETPRLRAAVAAAGPGSIVLAGAASVPARAWAAAAGIMRFCLPPGP
jgi:hypothetical protein